MALQTVFSLRASTMIAPPLTYVACAVTDIGAAAAVLGEDLELPATECRLGDRPIPVFSVGSAAVILLALVLIASLVVTRPWCNYLCPIGAVTDFLRFSHWQVRRRAKQSGTPLRALRGVSELERRHNV